MSCEVLQDPWLNLFGLPAGDAPAAAPSRAEVANVSAQEPQAPVVVAKPQAKATFTLRSEEGAEIEVTPIKVGKDVWEDSTKMARFVGTHLNNFTLSKEDLEAFREFLQEHDTEAVTDGNACFTALGFGLAYCHPERLEVSRTDTDAWIEHVAGELQAMYEAIFAKKKERLADMQRFRRRFERMNGIGCLGLNGFDDRLDEEEVAKQFISDLIGDKGRALLGLNRDVIINGYEVHQHTLEGFKARKELVDDIMWRRRHRSDRKIADEEREAINAPVEFSLLKACKWLVERYGGEAGQKEVYGQAASDLVATMRLERQAVAAKNGKVVLDLHFHCESYGTRGASHQTCENYAKMVQALKLMHAERGEPVPEALLAYNPRELYPSSTYELGPHLKLRTWKDTAKLTMTEQYALQVREFISTYRSSKGE